MCTLRYLIEYNKAGRGGDIHEPRIPTTKKRSNYIFIAAPNAVGKLVCLLCADRRKLAMNINTRSVREL